MEMVDVIDENDTVVGQATKLEVHQKGLLHRAASVLVFNTRGELLLQKRAATAAYPLHYCFSASGHIATGESYLDAAHRELKEELGIEGDLEPLLGMRESSPHRDGVDDEMIKVFKVTFDGTFAINDKEVDSVDFFPMKKISEMIKDPKIKFTPHFVKAFKKYYKGL